MYFVLFYFQYTELLIDEYPEKFDEAARNLEPYICILGLIVIQTYHYA